VATPARKFFTRDITTSFKPDYFFNPMVAGLYGGGPDLAPHFVTGRAMGV